MTEGDVKNAIMLELSKRGCKIFNRPTGNFYIKTAQGEYKPIKVNVRGASDLQGHRPDGRAVYLEVKKPGHKTNNQHLEEQSNFLEQMRKSGALAGMAESVEQAVEIVFGELKEEDAQ